MLQLLGLYQNHAIQMEMTTADDLLNHVIDMEKEPAEKKNVQLKTEYEAFSMKMDAALMESLLVNLIDNALKATVAGGSIWVKAYEKAGKRSLRCRILELGSQRKNWERSQMRSIWWTNHEAEKKAAPGLVWHSV